MTIDWVWQNFDYVVGLFGVHIVLSLVPSLLGLIISLPLGWWAHRQKRLYPLIVGATGLLYTIPSLALFILLPPLLGTKILDPVNVVAALTVYTVALLVRGVADGLGSVPFETTQAATAMGYRGWQRLVMVELPVAVPVIIGALRVAVVSNVSVLTMAALLGVPELGSLFTQGFVLRLWVPLVTGIILCMVLATVFDVLLVWLGRILTPWRQRGVAA